MNSNKRCITLTTDFGDEDGYAGILKTVILGINPDALLVDLSHRIEPQNIFSASLVLERAFPYCPAQTVHLAVVDPGVGSSRRPMAARCGSQFFVGPDNGLITRLLDLCDHDGTEVACVHLTHAGYWLPVISNTFHGRDIFAPVAAHLSLGIPLEQLGVPFADPVRFPVTSPQEITGTWQGEIIDIDHFGNLLTNLSYAPYLDQHQISIEIKGHTIHGIQKNYAGHPDGSLITLFGSNGYLEIARVNGNASHLLQATIGEYFNLRIMT